MLDPVVVKPLTTSKKASINRGISPVMTNGKAPKIDIAIQDNATITNPSLPKITIFLGVLNDNSPPIIKSKNIFIMDYILWISFIFYYKKIC